MPLATRARELGRLWRTVRHLRVEQVVGRAWFRLHRPQPDLRLAPPLRKAQGPWKVAAAREVSMSAPTLLSFLGVEHDLDSVGWDDPSVERLWRYNLHYFDDVNAQHASERRPWHRKLITRWVAENLPGQGSGWEPYPTSLRTVNWIKYFLTGEEPQAAWVHSLAVQLRWLRQRLEWHLLGNHLFINAKALVFAGLWFEGPEADAWLQRGLSILDRELPEQILPDGGQFERSPMYHALALEDLLDLINIIQARADAASPARARLTHLRTVTTSMLHWLRCMTHADGRLSLFNDCADGIAPDLQELERYAEALDIQAPAPAEGLSWLPDSGYIRMRAGQALLLADVAPLGPDYLVGHAHADTLSFELSLGARRLVVNGGTSCYGLGMRRNVERGTSAHSTVEVASMNSSEVWSGFRVGRRARPVGLKVCDGHITCAHDGYRYLRGAPLHRRQWTLAPGLLRVDDSLSATGHAAVARYPLAPGLRLQPGTAGGWQVVDGSEVLADVEITQGEARATPTTHSPRFGVVVPNETLTVSLRDGTASTCWRWKVDAHPLPH